MASKPETRLQQRIQKHLKEKFHFLRIHKYHGGKYSTSAMPDLFGFINPSKSTLPISFYIETKMPGESPKPHQVVRMKEIKHYGGLVTCVDNVQDAYKFIEKIISNMGGDVSKFYKD